MRRSTQSFIWSYTAFSTRREGTRLSGGRSQGGGTGRGPMSLDSSGPNVSAYHTASTMKHDPIEGTVEWLNPVVILKQPAGGLRVPGADDVPYFEVANQR